MKIILGAMAAVFANILTHVIANRLGFDEYSTGYLTGMMTIAAYLMAYEYINDLKENK